MGETKRFDDFTFSTVDCNNCESWWLNQCDGANKGSQKLCTAFVAVRRVNIPSEIERLRERVKWLEWVVGIGYIIIGLFMISTLGG